MKRQRSLVGIVRSAARKGKRAVKKFGLQGTANKFETKIATRKLVRRFKAKCKQENRKYLFSVVIASYNAGGYLRDAINSICTQSIGIENIQVIIVNDGSTDGTALICNELSAQYPKNIFFYEVENGGVSRARNFGLSKCEGYFVGFLDADDKISRGMHYEILKFASKHPETKIFTTKTKFFGAKGGAHPLNYICKKDQTVDLRQNYDMYPLSATRSYFHHSILRGKLFREDVRYTEDSLIVHEIMLSEPAPMFGALKKPLYYYRKREEGSSASDFSTTDTRWYLETIEKSHKYIFETAIQRCGFIPQYLQYAVMYDLGWRIRAAVPENIDQELVDCYKESIVSLLNRIDDEVILSVRNFDLSLKSLALAVKHGISLDVVLDSFVSQGSELVCDVSYMVPSTHAIKVACLPDWSNVTIDLISISDDGASIALEGILPKMRFPGDNVRLYFTSGSDRYDAVTLDNVHNKIATIFDEDGSVSIDGPTRFIVLVPSDADLCLTAHVSIGSGSEAVPVLSFGKFARLCTKYRGSSYAVLENGQVIFADSDKHVLYVQGKAASKEEIDHLERKYQAAISKDVKPVLLRYRNNAIRYRREHMNEQLWVFTDRVTSAEDSGEVMFRYMLDHPRENVHAVFIIRKDVPDYKRLKQLGGEVVPANTPAHYETILCADKIISSAGDEWVLNPFGSNYNYLKDLLHYKFIFLQHGVIKDNIAEWLHKRNKNIDLFVTSAPRERKSVIEGGYDYAPENIILTGLPRWDSFEGSQGEANSVIYLMPTWREYLSGGFTWNASDVSSVSSSSKDFSKSEYYRFYQSILEDRNLDQLLGSHGYVLKFAPHPRVGSSIGLFSCGENMEILTPESFSYASAYKEMAMLITDYSSVAFNVAILKKPVIYVQFDIERFYKGHTGKKDYYSYEEDGFGPIVNTKDELVEKIREFMESGMTMPDRYVERVDSFFFMPRQSVSRARCVMDAIDDRDERRKYTSFPNSIYASRQYACATDES